MNKKKCEVCGSSHTVKNGVRKGVQLYKCQDCGHQFRAGVVVSEDELWEAYQQEKQTIKELSERYGKSVASSAGCMTSSVNGCNHLCPVRVSCTWTLPTGDATSACCWHWTTRQVSLCT